MKSKLILIAILSPLLSSGCYTQLELSEETSDEIVYYDPIIIVIPPPPPPPIPCCDPPVVSEGKPKEPKRRDFGNQREESTPDRPRGGRGR